MCRDRLSLMFFYGQTPQQIYHLRELARSLASCLVPEPDEDHVDAAFSGIGAAVIGFLENAVENNRIRIEELDDEEFHLPPITMQ